MGWVKRGSKVTLASASVSASPLQTAMELPCLLNKGQAKAHNLQPAHILDLGISKRSSTTNFFKG